MKKIFLLLHLLIFIVPLFSCKEKYVDATTLNKPREGRIGIRIDDGTLKFFDKGNNSTFSPMGYNYTQLQDLTYNGVTFKGHATFSKDYYDASISEGILLKLQQAGYNTVRIFLNPASLSNEKGKLDSDYVLNIVDFIKKVDQHGLAVIITSDLIPISYYDKDVLKEEDVTWLNTQYINQDDINLEIDFWQTLIEAFQNNSVPLNAILSYEIRNEFYYHPEHNPFNENSGVIKHPNGMTYDMSIASDRSALMDASFLYWSTSIRNAILEKDTEALISVGFFAPDLLGTPAKVAITQSDLDFIDLHMYPSTATLHEYADYFDLIRHQEKLIIMGEFGYVENKDLSIEEMKSNLLNWKNDAISNYGIDGWLLWTWDTSIGIQLSVPDKNDVLFKGFSPKN